MQKCPNVAGERDIRFLQPVSSRNERGVMTR